MISIALKSCSCRAALGLCCNIHTHSRTPVWRWLARRGLLSFKPRTKNIEIVAEVADRFVMTSPNWRSNSFELLIVLLRHFGHRLWRFTERLGYVRRLASFPLSTAYSLDYSLNNLDRHFLPFAVIPFKRSEIIFAPCDPGQIDVWLDFSSTNSNVVSFAGSCISWLMGTWPGSSRSSVWLPNMPLVLNV